MSDEYSVAHNFQADKITADDYRYKMERLRAAEGTTPAPRTPVEAPAAGSMAEPSEPTPAETTESSEVSPQSSSGSCGPGGEGERE